MDRPFGIRELDKEIVAVYAEGTAVLYQRRQNCLYKITNKQQTVDLWVKFREQIAKDLHEIVPHIPGKRFQQSFIEKMPETL